MVQRVFTNQAFSNTGIVGVGFKIFFIEAGTVSTPLATFSDEALTIPNPNPVIADENGRFADVFVNELRRYKSVLTDELDNPLKTLDPIDPDIFSVAAADPRPLTLWGVTAGTVDNYTLVANPPIFTTENTHVFVMEVHVNCNAGCDLTVENTSAKSLKKYDSIGSKVDLEAGDLLASRRYFVTNDGADYLVFDPEILRQSVSVGAVTAFAFEIPPTGWLQCDGTAISRSTFSVLFTAIGVRFGIGDGSTTFNIPDLRGEFIRGWADGENEDPDRASRTNSGDGTTGDNVGTKQADEFSSHTHFKILAPQPLGAGDGTPQSPTMSETQRPTTNAATGGNETRPRNVYMMYAIKF